MEKYRSAGQATDDKMTHAHCMLDTSVYKHTLRILIALPLQQRLYERSVMLRYTNIACLVSHGFGTIECF